MYFVETSISVHVAKATTDTDELCSHLGIKLLDGTR